jgi:arylsulfatase A-like enzyme
MSPLRPLLALLALTGGLLAATRPNILIILADDQGYGDVGAYNPTSKIPTPHLDQFASEGLRFTDGHTTSGVCTPSRYSLLTGRYHWRTRLQNGVLGGWSPPLIAPGRLTVAGLLKQQGYRTACFGKWHLGLGWPTKDGAAAKAGDAIDPADGAVGRFDYAHPLKDGPLDHGFDTFFGISASLDMPPFVWIKDRQATELPTATKKWLRSGPAGPKFEAIDVLPTLTDQVIAYLEARSAEAKAGQPFFAYVALPAPHTPIVPTKEWQGKSGLNAYADYVREVDAETGRILAALAKEGLARDTLVIFTSDNGCSPAADIDELIAKGHHPSGPLRGHKADLFEGGHRVPFMARWPAVVRPGVAAQLVSQVDFLATFAELTGATLPANAGEDSVSFLPVLRDAATAAPRTSLVSQSINGSFAYREGNWKLALCRGSGGWSVPKPGSAEEAKLPEFQLYDLAQDLGETRNLLAAEPERAAKLRAALEAIVAQGRSTPGPAQPNDVSIALVKKVNAPGAKAKAKGKTVDTDK